MAHGSISSVMLVLLLGVICTATSIVRGDSQEWLVGDKMGWSFGVTGWVKDKPIHAGDVLVFNYDPTAHDVVEVDEDAYNTRKMPIGGGTPHTSSTDRVVVPTGKSFFVCSLPGHCANGMKITITA